MKCLICGKEIKSSHYNFPLCDSEKCFSDFVWYENLKDINEIYVTGDYNAYKIGPENEIYKGFDGRKLRKFKIITKDKIIMTTNLWHLGKVPENFRDKFKVNCKYEND